MKGPRAFWWETVIIYVALMTITWGRPGLDFLGWSVLSAVLAIQAGWCWRILFGRRSVPSPGNPTDEVE